MLEDHKHAALGTDKDNMVSCVIDGQFDGLGEHPINPGCEHFLISCAHCSQTRTTGFGLERSRCSERWARRSLRSTKE